MAGIGRQRLSMRPARVPACGVEGPGSVLQDYLGHRSMRPTSSPSTGRLCVCGVDSPGHPKSHFCLASGSVLLPRQFSTPAREAGEQLPLVRGQSQCSATSRSHAPSSRPMMRWESCTEDTSGLVTMTAASAWHMAPCRHRGCEQDLDFGQAWVVDEALATGLASVASVPTSIERPGAGTCERASAQSGSIPNVPPA